MVLTLVDMCVHYDRFHSNDLKVRSISIPQSPFDVDFLTADRVSHGHHGHGVGRGTAAGSRVHHRAFGLSVSLLYPTSKETYRFIRIPISGSLVSRRISCYLFIHLLTY